MTFPLVHPGQIDDWTVARDRTRASKIAGNTKRREFRAFGANKILRATVAVFGPSDRFGRLRRMLRSGLETPTKTETKWPLLGSLDFSDANAVSAALSDGDWSFQERAGRWTNGMQAKVAWLIRRQRWQRHCLLCRRQPGTS